MSQDTELRRSLHDAVERTDVPHVDVSALRAAGRREGRRRTALAALAAAAVVAVVIGAGVGLTQDATRRTAPGPAEQTEQPERSPTQAPATQPTTIADLPVGEPPALPYVRNATLYSPHVTTSLEGEGRLESLVVGGGVALGEHSSRGIVRVHAEDGLIPLGAEGDQIAMSSHGRWAAWLVPGQSQARVMLWDLRQGEVEEVRALPLRGDCCDDPVRLVGVDNAGRVFISSGSEGAFVWNYRTDTVELIDLPEGDAISQVVVNDVVRRSPPKEKGVLPRYTLGRVDETGRFVGEQQVSGYDVLWAPDLSRPARVVQPDSGPVQADGDRIEVLDTSTGDWRPMLVPSEVSLAGYLWKAGHLLVTVYDSSQHYSWLRCAVVNGTCELAADLEEEGADWLLPDR